MDYTYNILNEVYEWMISKKKNVEVRILKEKSKMIQENDYITFYNQDDKEKFVKVKVIKKELFDTTDDLLSRYNVNRIMPNHTEKDLKELLKNIYGDKLNQEKLVAFEFEYINSDLDIKK